LDILSLIIYNAGHLIVSYRKNERIHHLYYHEQKASHLMTQEPAFPALLTRRLTSFLVAPIVRHFGPISDNLDGLLPNHIRTAGFVNVAETRHYATLFGIISILTGQKV
jgi:hypothetical protein